MPLIELENNYEPLIELKVSKGRLLIELENNYKGQ